MSTITERLDSLRALIQQPEFLDGKGLSNTLPAASSIMIYASVLRLHKIWDRPFQVAAGFAHRVLSIGIRIAARMIISLRKPVAEYSAPEFPARS